MKEKELKKIIKEGILNEFAKQKHNIPNADYNTVSLVNDPKCPSGRNWAKNGGNFPIKRNGKIYYVSRSVVVSVKAFCRNPQGEWCILANQRGKGAQNNHGGWNTPTGYLDYHETFEHAAVRETWEETGVKIPENKLRMIGTESHPSGGREDVVIRFGAVLDGVTTDYPLSDANSEPGEVADIQWIPLSKVQNYRWNAKAQLYHARTVLGDYENEGNDKSIKDIARELYHEIKDNPVAMNLLLELLKKTNIIQQQKNESV